jgi:hypothetical protein
MAMLLAGCTTQPIISQPIAEPAPPLVVDSFCETARKRTWSLKDTPESIAEAQAWNRAVDRRCGVPGS